MMTTVKSLANVLALVLVQPAFILYCLNRVLLGKDRAFAGWSQLFSLIPGTSGVYLRRAFYRMVLARCGSGCVVGFGSIFSHATAEIGRNVYIGPYCSLGNVTLEDEVLLGSHVSIMNGGAQHGVHRLDIPIREQPGELPRVTVGRDSWIGERAVVQADVGRHCLIGAGAVVTRPIPDYAIAVGVPARVMRYREGAPVAPMQDNRDSQ